IKRSYFGGRWFPSGGVAHSSRLVHELAGAAARRGARIYDRTAAKCTVPTPAGVFVTTSRGSIAAQHVVHATAGAASILLPELAPFIVPIRAQVMSTGPMAPLFSAGLAVNWGDVYGRQLPDGRF